MKCMSCGNLIPDASTVCPYCNSSVGPVAAETPVTPEVSVQTTPVAPVASALEMVAPAAPVTPEVMAPVTPEAPVAPAPVAEPVMAAPTPEVAPVQMAAPVVPETPATPVLPQDQGMVSAPVQPVAPAAPVEAAPAPVQPEIVPTPAPTTTMVANGITPEGGFTGGEKIASTAEAKKSSKGKLIAIIVVAVILIAGIVAGVLYYNSQYKSAGKRIDSIVNGMFKDLANIKNEDVELASGTYTFEGSVNANETNISAKLNGKYAFDIANQIADYTLNVESINMGQELLDSGALNLELYAEKHKVYFLLQNFYEKYIYVDTEGMVEVDTETEELELDVNTMVIAIREATKAGLKAAPNTQTVGEVTIGGTKQKANIVEIELNEANAKKILKGFVNSLANNDKFLTEIARVSGEEKAEIKEGLLSVLEEDTDTDEEEYEDYLPKSTTTGSISFYTAMFGEEFLGATIKMNQVYDKKDENYDAEYYEDSKMVLNVYPKGNALKVDMTMNDKKLFEMSLEETYEKNSTEEKNEMDFSITLHSEESGAVTIKFKATVTSDLQPKVEKVNTKDSIAFENLTETDITNIYEKVKNYGTFGMLVDSIFSSLIEQPSYNDPYYSDPSYDYDYDYDTDYDYDIDYDYDYDVDYNSSL